tara:strand:- start:265 stop:465 length:201 start_codon:yes stop_codon:yes gene_type:complete
VRQPNYARAALKAPSLEALYEVAAQDTSPNPIPNPNPDPTPNQVVAQDTFLCPGAKLPHVARLLEL